MLRFFAAFFLSTALLAPMFSSAKEVLDTCTTDDADNYRFLKTSRLACVSCALEKQTGLVPSEKYMALLGVAAVWYYDGPTNTGGQDQKEYYRNVIERAQILGFCLESKNASLPIDGEPYGRIKSSDVGILNAILANRQKITTRDQEIAVAKYFGFSDPAALRAMMQDPSWRTAPAAERAKRFIANSENFDMTKDGNGKALRTCMNQLVLMEETDGSMFNLKKGMNPKSAEVCKAMANECGITSEFCTQSPSPTTPNAAGVIKAQPSFMDAIKGNGAK